MLGAFSSLLKLRDMQYEQLRALVEDGIADGEVQPLPARIFQKHEIQEAFSSLTKGRALSHPIPAILLMYIQSPSLWYFACQTRLVCPRSDQHSWDTVYSLFFK